MDPDGAGLWLPTQGPRVLRVVSSRTISPSMRIRLHHLLFASFLGIIGLLVALIVFLIGTGLRREFDAVFQRDLGRQLNLAQALVETSASTNADSLARAITVQIGSRVTLIDVDGTVLGDSFVELGFLAELENHADRPEVLGVLRGDSMSFSQRTSVTIGEPLLYGARRARFGEKVVVLRIAAPRTDIERAVRDVQSTVAFTGFMIMLLALAGAYTISKAFTRPLVDLADRAVRLARGDVTGKVPVSRVAELQDLATAFNRLTEERQERLSELSHERDEMQTLIDCMAEGVVALDRDARLLRLNRAARVMLGLGEVVDRTPVGAFIRDETLRRALEESVTDSARSNEIELDGRSLRLASRALDSGGAVTTLLDVTEVRHLEQVRRDFVANASHELKTPLTSIRGYVETLADDEPPPELRRQFVQSILKNTLRLQRLVEDLLDLSRLESGRWAAAQEAVWLRPIVEEAWALVSAQADAGPTFSVTGDALVAGDREGLFQIFRNLIENAVRHTESSGQIQVDVQSEAPSGFAKVTVADDGEGIPTLALPRIFERFYRADSSRARDVGGTGLGLSIVKHLVDAMGGDIGAASVLGAGTTIEFTVPLFETPPS